MNRTIWIFGLCAVLLTGCAQHEDMPEAKDSGAVAINFSAGVERGSIEAGTRGAVDGGASDPGALTLQLALANDQSTTDPVDYDNYGAVFTATRAAAAGNTATALTLSTPQYYLTNGRNSKVTGWYPAATTYDTGTQTVSWTIDGTQDVMTAVAVSGNKADKGIDNTALAFTHRLAQVQIWAYAVDNTAQTSWGNITKVELTDQKKSCSYALSADNAGTVTFSGTANNTFGSGALTFAPAVGSGATAQVCTFLVEPQSATSTALTLKVTTAAGGEQTVTVPAQAYAASTAYKVTLKMDKVIVAPTATIGGWTTNSAEDKEITI